MLSDLRTTNRSTASGFAKPLGWIEPIDAFQCFADDDIVAFLDSSTAMGPRARYSYLCVDPYRAVTNISFADLATEMALCHRAWPDAPTPFAGGAVGFIGYEAGAAAENLPRAPGTFPGVPDMQFGFYDLVFAWDHATHRMWLLSPFGDQQQRAEAALARLRQHSTRQSVPNLEWHGLVTREQHMARVARVLDYIRAGDIYQANMTAPFVAARPPGARAGDIYQALRAENPAPFSAFIACGSGCAVASVSPERFLKLDADGRIETRPIKGTRKRGTTPAEDNAQAAALLASAKDRAENLMIVDLLRNDISRVALPGSVRVPALHVLESFASVHHLVSLVEGRLAPGYAAVDLLRASFPGGSITGAPKIRAMQIIAELEERARGPYCGTAAWLGFDGAMDSSILIRTLTVTRDSVIAQAGGGIVADSDPEDEWEELLLKVRPMLRALGTA